VECAVLEPEPLLAGAERLEVLHSLGHIIAVLREGGGGGGDQEGGHDLSTQATVGQGAQSYPPMQASQSTLTRPMVIRPAGSFAMVMSKYTLRRGGRGAVGDWA